MVSKNLPTKSHKWEKTPPMPKMKLNHWVANYLAIVAMGLNKVSWHILKKILEKPPKQFIVIKTMRFWLILMNFQIQWKNQISNHQMKQWMKMETFSTKFHLQNQPWQMTAPFILEVKKVKYHVFQSSVAILMLSKLMLLEFVFFLYDHVQKGHYRNVYCDTGTTVIIVRI